MLQIFGGCRRSAASQHYGYLAGSIINTSGFRFWIGTVLWLLSDASSFVTGYSLAIDGAWVARRVHFRRGAYA